MYASAELLGNTQRTAAHSFTTVLESLDLAAQEAKREVLYDTLEVSVERRVVDDITLSSDNIRSFTGYTIIAVSAECVL